MSGDAILHAEGRMRALAERGLDFKDAEIVFAGPSLRLVRRGRGRPKVDAPKRQVTIRLDQEVLDHFRATGPGWQGRVNDILRQAMRR